MEIRSVECLDTDINDTMKISTSIAADCRRFVRVDPYASRLFLLDPLPHEDQHRCCVRKFSLPFVNLACTTSASDTLRSMSSTRLPKKKSRNFVIYRSDR